MAIDLQDLRILRYPDPRLRQRCQPVRVFNGELAALARRMEELMRAAHGVGLAAPQVGVPIRMFITCAGVDPPGVRVFVNPTIRDPQGARQAEEGCLSIPQVYVQVRRAARCRIEAQDLQGNPLALEGDEMVCRVWQHETDHLDGILILDRMGPGDRIATRKALRELEAAYRTASRR